MVTLILTEGSVLLLDTAVRDSRWAVRSRLAELDVHSIECTPLPKQPLAFRLATSTGEHWDLFPKWDTPDAVAIARTLLSRSG